MPLPTEVTTILSVFQSLFTAPTWTKVQVLLVGTLLARGHRTVAAALRQMGRGDDCHFSQYHPVLNRARWSRLAASRRLLRLGVKTFGQRDDRVTLVIDETLGTTDTVAGSLSRSTRLKPSASGGHQRVALVGVGGGGVAALDKTALGLTGAAGPGAWPEGERAPRSKA